MVRKDLYFLSCTNHLSHLYPACTAVLHAKSLINPGAGCVSDRIGTFSANQLHFHNECHKGLLTFDCWNKPCLGEPTRELRRAQKSPREPNGVLYSPQEPNRALKNPVKPKGIQMRPKEPKRDK